MPTLKDGRGVFMFYCMNLNCLHSDQQHHDECPLCGGVETQHARMVECADIDHNSQNGCGNEQCWKYNGENKCKDS